jgi:anti-anti-sigma regulatory factor
MTPGAPQHLTGVIQMMYIAESNPAVILVAPDRLISEYRLAFRSLALEHLERASHERVPFAIDLRPVREIDAAGLGILVLLQKRAREYGLTTRLIAPSPAVHEALRGARLDYLFEIVD